MTPTPNDGNTYFIRCDQTPTNIKRAQDYARSLGYGFQGDGVRASEGEPVKYFGISHTKATSCIFLYLKNSGHIGWDSREYFDYRNRSNTYGMIEIHLAPPHGLYQSLKGTKL